MTDATSFADVAQLVEHILGKDEVTGSIPVVSSTITIYTRITNDARHDNT
jgi:hypothetical protein